VYNKFILLAFIKMANSKKRLIIGISGASGIQYGIKLLQALQSTEISTYLIMTKAAEQVRHYECSFSSKQIAELADVKIPIDDVACSVASGSYQTLGMIVAPCSMHTLSEIAHGLSSNALTRAADVILKERRKLVLMARETPLHHIHIENMLKATQAGAIIAPPVPAFYTHPKTLDDIIEHSVGRVLDLFDLDALPINRWHDG
jgi:4-hydroxy-3-polyprenylbenzoate decarboxylase